MVMLSSVGAIRPYIKARERKHCVLDSNSFVVSRITFYVPQLFRAFADR